MTQPTQTPAQIGNIYRHCHGGEYQFLIKIIGDDAITLCFSPADPKNIYAEKYSLFWFTDAEEFRLATPAEYAEILPHFISHARAEMFAANEVAREWRSRFVLIEGFGDQTKEAIVDLERLYLS